MEQQQHTLQKSFVLDDKYTVLLFIKKGSNAETYRVKGTDNKLYFLKLFNYAKLHRTAFDSESNLLEIEFLKMVKHPNIVSYKDSGELIYENKKYGYLVLNFIPGETLAERIAREPITSWYDVKQFMSGVLQGLDYLHNLPNPIIHNEITPQNIMLDLSGESPKSIIIDFGYARSFHQSTKSYNREGLNLNYVASECFNNLYSPQSDLFSVGAVMYHLLFGMLPWFKEMSTFQANRIKPEDAISEKRKTPLTFPNISEKIADFDESILNIITKALQTDPDNRFQSANEFLKAMNDEIKTEQTVQKTPSGENGKGKIPAQKAAGRGFDAIAGMQQLKDQLKNDVIDLINDPEGAAMYNIAMPNGMLLYGPPGCGKTFFSEKFAEETLFNYRYVNPSELGSIYIHGSQGKIRALFDEARKNAPFIICLDEVSSIFPKRRDAREHQVGEVDEFLTQLNNCGKEGVFVIATTNFPDNIDEAVLRTGRLEIKIYVPPPDYDARKALFEMYLKEIPNDSFSIDYEKLSKLTENYVSSDIKSIVDVVARNCRKNRIRVTMEMLTEKIKNTIPSVKISTIEEHEEIRKRFESGGTKRKRIGFRIGNADDE